jgi:DNA-binding transcriptional LysR family regulator
MKIEYLRNFVKLTKYKSFSELVKDIPISQSTLSHQISTLEKEFGVVLINRTTKKFELTEAGRILLDYSQKIVKLYDSCEEDLTKYSKHKFEDIAISASTIPGSHILPRYIAKFRNKNPNANFIVKISNSQKSIENVAKGLADFAGIGSFINYNENDFDSIKIGEDEFKFICSPNHEEYNKLNIKLEINDNDSIISAVSESNYISIMSEYMADNAEKAGLIKILEIKGYPVIVRRPLYFIKLREKELSDLKKDFWEYIKKNKKNQ